MQGLAERLVPGAPVSPDVVVQGANTYEGYARRFAPPSAGD
jgi:hypothetical protein